MVFFELVKNGVLHGLSINNEGLITLGEQGRGRKLVLLRAEGAAPGSRIEIGAIQMGPTGKVVAVQNKPEAARSKAGVIIRDHSGYRGGWTWKPGVPSSYCPNVGRPWDLEWANDYGTVCPDCGRQRGWMDVHPETGGLAPAHTIPGTPLAEGYKAQGMAGRMGGGPELFVMLEPGQGGVISRTGRLYGGPETLLVRWDGQQLTCEPLTDYLTRVGGVAKTID